MKMKMQEGCQRCTPKSNHQTSSFHPPPASSAAAARHAALCSGHAAFACAALQYAARRQPEHRRRLPKRDVSAKLSRSASTGPSSGRLSTALMPQPGRPQIAPTAREAEQFWREQISRVTQQREERTNEKNGDRGGTVRTEQAEQSFGIGSSCARASSTILPSSEPSNTFSITRRAIGRR